LGSLTTASSPSDQGLSQRASTEFPTACRSRLTSARPPCGQWSLVHVSSCYKCCRSRPQFARRRHRKLNIITQQTTLPRCHFWRPQGIKLYGSTQRVYKVVNKDMKNILATRSNFIQFNQSAHWQGHDFLRLDYWAIWDEWGVFWNLHVIISQVNLAWLVAQHK